jgi:hypothetical protein
MIVPVIVLSSMVFVSKGEVCSWSSPLPKLLQGWQGGQAEVIRLTYSSGMESNPNSFGQRVNKHSSLPPRWTRDGVPGIVCVSDMPPKGAGVRLLGYTVLPPT